MCRREGQGRGRRRRRREEEKEKRKSGTNLVVVRVELGALQPGLAVEDARVLAAAALLVLLGGAQRGPLHDALGGVLGHGDDVRRGVRRDVAGEDGGVDDVDVVRTVDTGVEVDDGIAAVAAVPGAELAGAWCGW